MNLKITMNLSQGFKVACLLLLAFGSYQTFASFSVTGANDRGKGILDDELLIQDQTIRGIVTDTNGEALPGVTVRIKGTNQGTITDMDGAYSLNANVGDIIVVSFVGFVTQEVTVDARTTYDITLSEDLGELDEVVIIGYGAVKKSDLTGSVASVSAKDLNKTINTSFADALDGRAAGVQVLNGEGTPGGAISIRVRGGTSISASNEPLYVIDGFPIIVESSVDPTTFNPEQQATTSSNPLAGIDPQDIQSIEILKDASATAIYGSRGANGVVLITTKRGDVGRTKVTFDAFFSSQEVTDQIDVLDGQQYAQYRLDTDAVEGDPNTADLRAFLLAYLDDPSLAESVNWQDEVYRTAPISSYRVGVSGGSENLQYNLSVGAFLNEGIIKESSFDRYNARLNLNGKLSDKASIAAFLTGSFSQQNGVPTGGNNASRAGVVTYALDFPPLVVSPEVYEDDLNNDQSGNPADLALNAPIETKRDFFQGNVSLDYEIIEGLTAKTLVGATTNGSRSSRFWNNLTAYGALNNGRAEIFQINDRSWINENTISYTKDLNSEHSISALGGFMMQAATIESFSAGNTDFAIQDLGFNNIGAGASPITPTSSLENWSIASFLSRVNYSFRDKYLLTASIRADGSSRFAEGKKWGYFPSMALAWKINEESFLQGVDAVNTLKLRAGFGITGNQEIPRYRSLAALGVDFYSFGLDNGNVTAGVYTDRVANPDLTWETTTQYNIGLDFGFFKSRVYGTVDLYQKKTEDMLLSVNLIPTAGIVAPALRNAGSLENRGIEVALNTVNVETKNFSWTTSFNIASNRNEILELGAFDQIFFDVTGGNHRVVNEVLLEAGLPVGTFYGYQTAGILGQDANGDPLPLVEGLVNEDGPGSRIFVDQITVDTDGDGIADARDGVINEDDRVNLGTSLPKHYGGITNQINYKGIELTVFFNWSYGNKVYNAQRVQHEELTNPSNRRVEALNAWTPDNQDTDIAAYYSGEYDRFLDRFVEDGSFIRLKSISLGYNFSNKLLAKTPLSSAKVYVSGQNLWTGTDYTGYNPEANVSPVPVAGGIDWGAYPLPKIYTIGFNVSF